MDNNDTLLCVENLEVTFALRAGSFQAVKGVSFRLGKGERLGLVGESGAGKSITGFSIINLISPPGRISGGRIMFEGRDLSKLAPEQMRSIRGDRVAMIFQDPMMTLNPVLTVGQQMVETVKAHRKVSTRQAREIAVEKLAKVHISSPERRLTQYPHEFSGGMRQRIVIAISLLANPALIIADEPSTALDVTIQAEIMELLLELCRNERMGLILISHDLGVVSQVTERMAIMYAGSIVEMGPTERIIANPRHPYTRGLLAALPGNQARRGRLNQIPGVMPGLANIPTGCAFHPRCQEVLDICRVSAPCLRGLDGVDVACHACGKEERP
uniref:ABC transporter ATP-binding protein n=1 Tax=Fundidesulfovibrio putealis TaxID=270496 RepID=A0A7C4AG79_9BACT